MSILAENATTRSARGTRRQETQNKFSVFLLLVPLALLVVPFLSWPFGLLLCGVFLRVFVSLLLSLCGIPLRSFLSLLVFRGLRSCSFRLVVAAGSCLRPGRHRQGQCDNDREYQTHYSLHLWSSSQFYQRLWTAGPF